MIIGSIMAIGVGTTMTLFSLIFGNTSNSFSLNTSGGNATNLTANITLLNSGDAVLDSLTTNAIYFTILGAGTFVASFFMIAFWMVAGERQSIKYRVEYFKALLRQDISWHDAINPNKYSTKVSDESKQIQQALGEKVMKFGYQ